MKYLFYILVLIVSGCASTHPVVFPEKNNLTTATVNQKYQEMIEIKGGAVNESSVSVNIIPSNSGLIWTPDEIKHSFGGEGGINKDYHRIMISGIPKEVGNYSVIISGFTLGTSYSGKDFYRKYTIKVKQ